MKKEVTIVDIECEDRGISGEIRFSNGDFDEFEMMDIAQMLMRVIESWCSARDFIHENIEEYNVTFN